MNILQAKKLPSNQSQITEKFRKIFRREIKDAAKKN